MLEHPSILVLGPSSSGSDEVDPILSKYSIEEPLTAWPAKPVAADTPAEARNNNGKRPMGTVGDEDKEGEEEGKEAKKSKTEDSSSDSDSDSDDSDSDSSDSSSSDSDDSDDAEDKDEGKDETETEVVVDSTQDSMEQEVDEETVEESADKPERADGQEEEEHANLELGQAILAAFNQDFGEQQD